MRWCHFVAKDENAGSGSLVGPRISWDGDGQSAADTREKNWLAGSAMLRLSV
jgi:hypothetical protein